MKGDLDTEKCCHFFIKYFYSMKTIFCMYISLYDKYIPYIHIWAFVNEKEMIQRLKDHMVYLASSTTFGPKFKFSQN